MSILAMLLAIMEQFLKQPQEERPTGINSITAGENKLKIYPNPSDEKFTLEFANPNNKLVTITITDLTDKTIFEATSNEEKYEFNGKELQAGVFVIKVTGDRFYYGKILVK